MIISLLGIGGFLWRQEWVVQRDVIYLRKGRTIVADQVWTGGKLIYYQIDDKTGFILADTVEQVVEDEFIDNISGKQWFLGKTRPYWLKFKALVGMQGESFRDIEALRRSDVLYYGAGLVLVLLLITFLLLMIGRKKRKQTISPDVQIAETPVGSGGHCVSPMADTEEKQIVYYFLNLYRLQMGVAANAKALFNLVDGSEKAAARVYELRVLINGEWQSRRMSIGLLGDESGSKSRCYYVIYDVHMVLKIPPKPLNDFSVYIDAIRRESSIVGHLAPRECIVPRVSVILRRFRQFHDEDRLSPEEMEARYIRWLINSVEAQGHLKIGDTFVFFMDLSQYFFLAHIIDNLHNLTVRLTPEILGSPDIIWDAQAFSGRYGHEYSGICFKLQDLYSSFETAVRKRAGDEGISPPPTYRTKDWFLKYLAGEKLTGQADSDNPDNSDTKWVGECLSVTCDPHIDTVVAYRDAVRHYLKDVVFSRNKSQLNSIIVNLLELLDWLGQKKVAMRDLKPDNLLVAGDRSQYPYFLSSPDQFSIGLIDVETAVRYAVDDTAEIEQPQLGGTPFYATPSHFLKNEYIIEGYGDISKIFHLQDWQATLAMIYKVVIGTPLLEQTGRLFPLVRTTIQKRLAQSEYIKDIIIDINRLFWRSAAFEFEMKMDENSEKLKSLLVRLPDELRRMLIEVANEAAGGLDKIITLYIQRQRLFPGENNHRQLYRATRQQIQQLKSRFENQAERQKNEKSNIGDVVKLLDGLLRLKGTASAVIQGRAVLNTPASDPTVYDILQIMFNYVLNEMHKPEWREFAAAQATESEDGASEVTYEATI